MGIFLFLNIDEIWVRVGVYGVLCFVIWMGFEILGGRGVYFRSFWGISGVEVGGVRCDGDVLIS